MASLFSHSSQQLQGTRGTGGRERSIPGSLSYIFSCGSSSSGQQGSLRLQRGGKCHPLGAGWMVFQGLVYIYFFLRKCFSSDSFSVCFVYKQNLCCRSLTPTDLLGIFARGRINPESRDWWDFLFPYLPLIQRAHSPCSLTSFQALFAKCCSLIICLLTSGFLPWSFPLLFHMLILLKTHPNLQAAPTANYLHFWFFFFSKVLTSVPVFRRGDVSVRCRAVWRSKQAQLLDLCPG